MKNFFKKSYLYDVLDIYDSVIGIRLDKEANKIITTRRTGGLL